MPQECTYIDEVSDDVRAGCNLFAQKLKSESHWGSHLKHFTIIQVILLPLFTSDLWFIQVYYSF